MSDELKKLIKDINSPAEWVALRKVKETTQFLVARNGQFESCSTNLDEGYMVEVLCEGQFAYVAASDQSREAIQRACDQAVFLAKSMAPWKLYSFTKDVRNIYSGEYQTPTHTPLSSLAKDEAIHLLMKATKEMKVSEKIVNTSGYIVLVEKESHIFTSTGADIYQHTSQVLSDLEAVAQEGSQIQTRSTGLPCYQGGLELIDPVLLEEEAQRVAREAIELLTAEPCPTGLYDLVLAPDQLYLQLHESIGHPLEIDRILGDERNYAGWSFVNLSDFGTLQYGSPLLNVVFDPTIPNELATYGYDDTGLKATKEYLIKDGLLVRGLGGSESQKRSGVPGVACTRASSWNRPPIDRMANVNIEPGSSSFEDMISGVEKGIFMQTNKSWSIDDYRRKFQFGCEYATLIENGKLTKPLRNPNYRGTTTDFWKNLKKVGDPSTFNVTGSPMCGKGEPNQGVTVGHAVPMCLFENVEVFGSES